MCNMKCIHFRLQQVCGFSGYVILWSESTSGHSNSTAFVANITLWSEPTSGYSRSAVFLANFIQSLSAQSLGLNVRTIPQFQVQQMVPPSCLFHKQINVFCCHFTSNDKVTGKYEALGLHWPCLRVILKNALYCWTSSKRDVCLNDWQSLKPPFIIFFADTKYLSH